MTNAMSRIEKASQMFVNGCACSQAVLSAYGLKLGLPRDLAMKIAAGFAGGMRLGETCGAVTGAIMGLGLRYSSDHCEELGGRTDVYSRVVEFSERFKKMNGSLICRELLGCDISTQEGMKEAQDRQLFKTICVKMVEDAVKILEALESESQSAV